jgi:hypothetical protein
MFDFIEGLLYFMNLSLDHRKTGSLLEFSYRTRDATQSGEFAIIGFDNRHVVAGVPEIQGRLTGSGEWG